MEVLRELSSFPQRLTVGWMSLQLFLHLSVTLMHIPYHLYNYVMCLQHDLSAAFYLLFIVKERLQESKRKLQEMQCYQMQPFKQRLSDASW